MSSSQILQRAPGDDVSRPAFVANPRSIATLAGAGRLSDVVDALAAANEGHEVERTRRALPSRDVVASVVADLAAALYPSHFGVYDPARHSLRHSIEARLVKVHRALSEQVERGIAFVCKHAADARGCPHCELRAAEITGLVIARLPALRALLDQDVRAAFEGDPAARFVDETLFCYPGVAAILQHRIAHELHQLEVPLLPRIISELAHAATGIDIHPGAQIGPSFFIDHGTGVVIGETCQIGARVRIYQGVTLGARGFPNDEHGYAIKHVPRHPIVEDDVVIYAGATLLGRITIGRGSVVGGNVWLTRSVPPGSQVTQARTRYEFENGAGI